MSAVCSTCNDTHLMPYGEDRVMCTRCPVPCQECRAGGTGAFCGKTPCECQCHDPRLDHQVSAEHEGIPFANMAELEESREFWTTHALAVGGPPTGPEEWA